ncbi:MAG: SMC family ATPase [Candidatus Cohnella colombiensis]|uniref:Nuclease SbcCD subunit C n=1 Tax=Candidatus Cohnella colombiensis TaxID=3121368 RepID=A0AA95EYJ0_9BACL|nr:MAG: SMC family ATPase [Cohnella sp.]
MRPIVLKMTAFGPYRDVEMIDFRELEDRRLFVISGNTGAGKTTIFDAICFALFGSASGEDRAEARMLRSQFADDDVSTAVDLLFSVGTRTYRIVRQMGHRKGSNKTETPNKAELYETTSGQEVPCTDRFTVTEVNAKLEAIIGLTKEQFSQIVMLPQGEFRKLLTSDTENKEDILRRIFRTGRYQKLEDRFQERNKELVDAMKQAKSMQAVYVKQVQETLPERLESALSATLQQEHYSSSQVMEGLSQEIVYYDQKEEEVTKERQTISLQLEQQEKILHEAISLNERFNQLKDKCAQRDEMALRQEEMNAQEIVVRLAEQADKIVPYELQALQLDSQVEVKHKQLLLKKEEVTDAQQGLTVAQTSYRAEEAREQERQDAQLEVRKLTELVPIVQTLEQRRLDVQRLLMEEQASANKRDTIDEQLKTLRDESKVHVEQLKSLEVELQRLAEVKELYKLTQEKYRWLKEMLTLDVRLTEAVDMQTAREQAIKLARAQVDEQEALWLEGQAGYLAMHLHDGQPCPVCGSEAHPAKAETQINIPSREAVQTMKEQLRIAEQQLNEAQAQVSATVTIRSEKQESMGELDISDDNFDHQLLQAEKDGKAYRAEKDRLEAQERTEAPLRQAIEQMTAEIERLQAERERVQAQWHELKVARSSKQSLLENEWERVPEQIRTPENLHARIVEQSAYAKQLTDTWQSVQQKYQQMQQIVITEQTNALGLSNQLEEMKQQNVQAQERYKTALAQSGFADPNAYQAAKLSELDRKNRLQQLEHFRTSWSAVVTHIAELERELHGKALPQLDTLQTAIAALKQQLEGVTGIMHTHQRNKLEAQRLHNALELSHDQMGELEQEQQQVADIYQMLKGDNALKISFERYILIEYLEQILHAANERLAKLSKGQFILQRSDRLESRGKQSGLGLDVYDAYTGQNRDVKSLSGGEKFNASLCLALGMTDVIQAYQGGVSIEMMFIDEGFGSLDDESLNKAIEALIDLQRAGRMIGVISHVQELKQAFPAVLEVSKTREGHSRTSFIVK